MTTPNPARQLPSKVLVIFKILIITDVRMPGLDGVSVVHHIRGSAKSGTPVMAISGTPWHFEDAAFDVVLEKPFSIKALVEHLAVLGDRTAVPGQK